MNSKTSRFLFGALVSSLREDLRLTQSELSDRSGLKLTQIRAIEQGLMVDLLKENALIKLASALKLTTFERYQFFLSANGIFPPDVLKEDEMLHKHPYNAPSVLEDVSAIVKKQHFPAFVVDAYCDVIAANRIVIELLNISMNILNTNHKNPSGYNILRILFDPDSNYRKSIGDNWEFQTILTMRFFRRISLRYRVHPYYTELLKNLRQYHGFLNYWTKTVNEIIDENQSFSLVKENNPKYGLLEFTAVESLLTISPVGELYMIHYLPLSNSTSRIFESICKVSGEQVLLFSPFPDKRKLWDFI